MHGLASAVIDELVPFGHPLGAKRAGKEVGALAHDQDEADAG